MYKEMWILGGSKKINVLFPDWYPTKKKRWKKSKKIERIPNTIAGRWTSTCGGLPLVSAEVQVALMGWAIWGERIPAVEGWEKNEKKRVLLQRESLCIPSFHPIHNANKPKKTTAPNMQPPTWRPRSTKDGGIVPSKLLIIPINKSTGTKWRFEGGIRRSEQNQNNSKKEGKLVWKPQKG